MYYKNYKKKSNIEIKRLAMDVLGGRVFTSKQSNDPTLVFMALAFASGDEIDELITILGPRGILYEYLDNAGPRSINGLPTFFSFNVLSSEDTDRLNDMIEKVKAAVTAIA